MIYRKKRCTNPACRRFFSYAPEGKISCPWCGEGSQRNWVSFHFGVDRIPTLKKGYYTVRLDRPVDNKKVVAIKALRNAWVMTGAEPIRLKDAKHIMDRVWNGHPYVLEGQTDRQVQLMMLEGQVDLSFRRGKRVSLPCSSGKQAGIRQQRDSQLYVREEKGENGEFSTGVAPPLTNSIQIPRQMYRGRRREQQGICNRYAD